MFEIYPWLLQLLFIFPSQARIKQLHISAADTRPSANTVIEMAGGSRSGQ